jgi:hypothetical protein
MFKKKILGICPLKFENTGLRRLIITHFLFKKSTNQKRDTKYYSLIGCLDLSETLKCIERKTAKI